MSMRSTAVAAAAGLVVVVALATWALSDRGAQVETTPVTPSVAVRAESVPPPRGGTIEEVQRAAKPLPVVSADLDEAARLPGGVTVRVANLTVATVEAIGPGEVGGRALVVRIEVTNGSKAPLDLAHAWVQVSRGAKQQVAPPQTSLPYDPLSGTLAPGRSAKGTYVFAIGRAKTDNLSILVTGDLRRPQVRFEGDLS